MYVSCVLQKNWKLNLIKGKGLAEPQEQLSLEDSCSSALSSLLQLLSFPAVTDQLPFQHAQSVYS